MLSDSPKVITIDLGLRSNESVLSDLEVKKSPVSEHVVSIDLGLRSSSVLSTLELEKKSRVSNDPEATNLDDDFPDGGLRAWLVVFGGMCNTFATFGYANSWGVFQSYYQTEILKNSSASSIAWIGSIQYALVLAPGLVVGRLFDLGFFRSLFLTSSVLVVGATFLVAESDQYWQFLLYQGIVVGIGCGGIFSPTLALVAQWFKRKRGLAIACVAMGASIGGTVSPLVARVLLTRISFQWTMRTFGFILFFALAVGNLLIKRRLPPRQTTGPIVDLRVFLSPLYSVYCVSAFICFVGIYSMLIYVGGSAIAMGLSQTYGFYLVAIINGSSFVGRYISGLLSDKIGPLNVMIPLTTVAGILVYAWPFAQSQRELTIISVLYGFSSGAYISLAPNPVMQMGKMEDVGRLTGMFLSCLAIGALIGPPISGAIAEATEGYKTVGYFAGSCVIGSVCMMCVTRQMILKQRCST